MPPFHRSGLARAVLGAGLPLALAIAGCGGEIKVDSVSGNGAELFNQRCSGCHSLESANAYGSKTLGQKWGSERTNGPDFNVRKEPREDILFAIRNGGFSGAIMPANVAVGDDAEKIADFLEKYSGKGPSN